MQTNSLFETFRELTAIDSPSFGERRLCDLLTAKLTALGVACEEDGALCDEETGGNCGNLYGYLPGDLPGAPLLFSAHMDTVEPARGKRAILSDRGKITSDGTTVLGADNVSGITVILKAIELLRESGARHRSLELLFTAAEERYGAGSALAGYSGIQAKEAYVLDLSGAIGEAANAAPTILSFTVTVRGKASHAGFAPKEGVSAIAAAAKAIARIPLGELSGLTCNIGVIHGGEAGNIIPACCKVTGEIRSLSHTAVLEHWEKVRAIFEEEARAMGAAAEFARKAEITAYETPLNRPVVKRFRRACETAGLPCNIHSTLGGSDNNNFALHGIEGLVVACSMHDVHSTREFALLDELEQCVRLTVLLMSAAD
ncbi:MAG: M20/M25/M40 family metallo-hydrolase [Clostridiales bacterium]|jgi:tripeptide aminopeptidase|nr:M20/M25/M40 family metallo-hydrolase [Clostridiales bacterium]